jgi:hypothetical protein
MFEQESEEWVENNLHSTEEDYIKAFKDGAEFGYEQGIARLRYCCTCKHYIYDGTEPYGICADWEIMEIEE